MFEKKKDESSLLGVSSSVFRPVKGSAKVVIGNGVKIKGEITDADEVQIDGTADVTMITNNLVIGALGGHAIMGLSLSVSSIMGLLALIGVVVNDSLVLVDYINKKIKEGLNVSEAVRVAGGARFRPILLTSLTTFAGLTPLITEKSTQAQFLIPMAVSLGFGILFATLLTLVLIPTFYLIVEDIKGLFVKLSNLFTPSPVIEE